MEKKFVNKTGGCICGAVKFNVTLDELPRVFSCHCIDCRKKIGGIMSIIELRKDAIDINKSLLSTFEHIGGSGNKITKYFCGKCAAPVLTYVERWNKFYLYAGLLDDISILKKSKNIYYEWRQFTWKSAYQILFRKNYTNKSGITRKTVKFRRKSIKFR